jgi:hypothetical protein
VYGQPVVIHGQVARSNDGTGIAGAHVLVQARLVGSTSWQTLLSALTTPTGAVRAQHVPTGATQYRIVTVSGWSQSASVSGTGQVSVSRAVSAVAQSGGVSVSSVHHGTPFLLIGVAQPRGTGVRVYLQRWSGSGYVLVASTVAGINGRYAFAVSTPTAGSYSFRTFVYGDSLYAGYSTPRVTVTVT